MNFEIYASQFREKAKDAGYSSESIYKCLNYSKRLIDNQLPVIYNSTHFSSLVGYKRSYLARAIVFTPFFYRKFYIRKCNGGIREICEPLPSLKEIQTWILRNILYQIPVSKLAKAYVPGTSLKQNLVFHKEQKVVLKLDIRDFFGNIRRVQIEKFFRHIGYSLKVSNLISKLCCLDENLPQGAPTSAYLSNLIFRDVDQRIYEFCQKINVRYSRYADDLTFSGDFDHFQVISYVQKQLSTLSLEVNATKTRVMGQGQRQSVTGIVVNKKLQVDKVTRKEIRQAVYYIKRHGLNEHMARIGNNKRNYLRHLLGRVLYVIYINPEDEEFLGYKRDLTHLLQLES